MILRKVKYTKGAGLLVDYIEEKVIGEDQVSLTDHQIKCKDQPHPDLVNALAGLEDIVRYDEGLKKTTPVTVTGVSFFNDGETVIITHTREVKSGVSVRNSGRISLDDDERFDKVNELFTALGALRKEVLAFLNGKRAQLEMFTEDVKVFPDDLPEHPVANEA